MNKTTFEIEASLPTSEQAALMSNAALGCYVKLMCCAWREGSIPSDVQRIAKLCGESPQTMPALWEQIQESFIEDMIRPGRLIHVGLERQRIVAKAVSCAKSKAGSLGAARRWGPRQAESVLAAPTASGMEASAGTPPSANASNSHTELSLSLPATPRPTEQRPAHPAGAPNIGMPQADLFAGVEPPSAGQIQPPKAEGVPPCPQVQVIELYHRLLATAPKVLTWGDTREALLRQRWREMATTKNEELGNGYKTQDDGLAWWTRYFTYVAQSPFLTGKAPGRSDGPPFVATLEWLIRPKNFAKVLEGQYHRT